MYPETGLPWGLDHLHDIRRLSEALDHPIRTIWDVGAHLGQSAAAMLRYFPDATVRSFEPHQETFQLLQSNISSDRFEAHNFALGASSGQKRLFQYDLSYLNSLIDDAPAAVRFDCRGTSAMVEVDTIDALSRSLGIERIDFLKIDTEGCEIEVLDGASTMLREGAIRFVYAEFNELLSSHRSGTTLQGLENSLAPHGYAFAATYTDHIHTEGEMFFVRNALFVHRR